MSATKVYVWLTSGLNPLIFLLSATGVGALLGFLNGNNLSSAGFGALIGFLLGCVFGMIVMDMLKPCFYSHNIYSIRKAVERGEYPAACVDYDGISRRKKFDEMRRDELASYVKSCPRRTDADFAEYLSALRDAEELMTEYDKLLALKPK